MLQGNKVISRKNLTGASIPENPNATSIDVRCV
jgi:hypothetical protein